MKLQHLEHELAKIQVRLSGLKARLELSWKKLINDIEPEEFQAIQQLLQRGHDQAQYVLAHGELPGDEPAVPWELAHGLSILNLGKAEALPTSEAQLPTRVLKDGTLLGCRKWELLDLLWSEALIKWIENLRHHAVFMTTPTVMMIDNEVSLAIAGDWGTGPFDSHAPAVNVANRMKALQADVTIHLGDVYYAGTGSEEDVDMAGWPMGKHGAFTLNSNHEMYSGAHGYFAELNARFPVQQGTSYFALYNDDWLIVGLDSAYAAAPLNLYMDGNLNQQQIDWMKTLPKRGRLLVLTHHQGFDITGHNPNGLYRQVSDALGRVPDYWYWGHLHNGIVYAELDGLKARCAGHGAIPYGVTSELDGNRRVLFSETQNAGDPDYPERVLNGFARVRLSGANIVEEFIGEDGSVRWTSQG